MAAKKRSANAYYLLLAGFTAVYVWLTFAIPPDPRSLAKYHLTVNQSHLLSLTLLPLIVGLWYALFYGFIKVKNYSYHVAGSKEGKGFRLLAHGLGTFAVISPLSSLINQTLNYYSRADASRVPLVVNISSYINVSIYVAALGLLYLGAKALTNTLGKQKKPKLTAQTILYWVFGGAYGYLLLTKAQKNTPPQGLTHAQYYMSDPVIALTIILPYLIAWYLGLVAASKLSYFSAHVEGSIYKLAIKRLSIGVTIVVVTSVLLQLFTLFGSKLGNWNLGPLLALIYVLIAAISVGYLFLASGAKKLSKIEEVV